jgi:formamidopyrimidine-DNA glycosylase
MPELPECEAARRVLEALCLGKKIVKVLALEGGGGPRNGLFDDIIFSAAPYGADGVTSLLEGKKVAEVCRKGKHLFLMLEGAELHLLIHFGMTGNIRSKVAEKSPKVSHVHLMSLHGADAESDVWPPRYTKLELVLESGSRIALTDPRRLARCTFRKHPLQEAPISQLGADPLIAPLSLEQLSASLGEIRTCIKAVLLDQNRLFCGIGNWLCDDILYQAHIHPLAVCNTLSGTQILALHSSIISIVKEACVDGADSSKFPPSWLFHLRWERAREGIKDFHGRRLEIIKAAGRTTVFCPLMQKMGECKARKKIVASVKRGTGKKNRSSSSSSSMEEGSSPWKRRKSDGMDEGLLLRRNPRRS